MNTTVKHYETATKRDAAEAEMLACVASYFEQGLHLVKVRPFSKVPVSRTWTTDPNLTVREAIEHLRAEGNIAMHLGKSGLMVYDVDATTVANAEFLGARPFADADVRTPNGGAHYWQADTPGVDRDGLLHGNRFVLLPPSRLRVDEEPDLPRGFRRIGAAPVIGTVRNRHGVDYDYNVMNTGFVGSPPRIVNLGD
ncbi:bifunctional DNA primase/polymerase [Mycobacteroides abscessus]|uniref:bifunctional DNA primase/polymerase n=1 Tax=Mycobacteroides abscessus TaxID=36809 RepID=UPI00078BF6C1|nr:bifunctional DNA primase/polymerase [Mycobacteroides abscessus]QSM04148.1 DNA primase/polymerase [Mycobacterium phage prophiGD51-2]AMU55742.1 hypothetical protein A3O02_11610 [Mycobacteroides abscessus]MBE5436506.1 hypothetical protein [Mycobacteroides abscessus]MBN7447591.1 bifunctional DNA primase/polymerase [Mycobacteroides abscessus subsp. abscessus]MDM1901665.1 bifunctional DNA primase/polymerase [Mycobacteroides abscessus]